MERLKTALADKILDLSSDNRDDVKVRLDRIQRFRDFSNACQTLMIKYPKIEDELMKMVNDGDFDTKVASSRVDTVIRLTDTEAAYASKLAPQIVEAERVEDIAVLENITAEIEESKEEDILPELQDIDVETDLIFTEEELQDDYIVDYEDVNTESDIIETAIPEYVTEEIKPYENLSLSEEELAAAKRKLMIRRIIQVAGIILAVVGLIFVVKFVMVHWQAILIIAGILAVLAILFVWFKRKRS